MNANLPLMKFAPEAAWKSRREGFTLVELLVVIAVIGLLAALLSPVLKKSRDRARSVQCVSNLRQIGIALVSYAGENDGLIKLGHSTGYDFYNPGANQYPSPLFALVEAPLYNPSQPGSIKRTPPKWVLTCPSARDITSKTFGYVSYTGRRVNDGAISGTVEIAGSGNSRMIGYVSLDQISPKRALFADMMDGYAVPLYHGRGVNVLYADGGVAWFNDSAGQILTPNNYVGNVIYDQLFALFDSNR